MISLSLVEEPPVLLHGALQLLALSPGALLATLGVESSQHIRNLLLVQVNLPNLQKDGLLFAHREFFLQQHRL